MNNAPSRRPPQFSRSDYPTGTSQTISRNRRSGTNIHTHPYLRPGFWANSVHWFWENEGYTEKAKEYFRAQIATLVSDRHNAVHIKNAQV